MNRIFVLGPRWAQVYLLFDIFSLRYPYSRREEHLVFWVHQRRDLPRSRVGQLEAGLRRVEVVAVVVVALNHPCVYCWRALLGGHGRQSGAVRSPVSHRSIAHGRGHLSLLMAIDW